MSQENVEIIRRLWLAYVRQDYEASTEAFDDAVELSSDPRANMETGLVSGREAVIASIAGFVSSFDDYWCEEPEELIEVGDLGGSGGPLRRSGANEWHPGFAGMDACVQAAPRADHSDRVPPE